MLATNSPRLQLVGTEVLQLTERHQLDVLGRLKLALHVVIQLPRCVKKLLKSEENE